MKQLKILVSLSLTLLLTSCGTITTEVVPEDTKTTRVEILSGTTQNISHEVEGISIETRYDTNGYDLANWLLTDSKMVSFTLRLSRPSASEVLVEHVHLDINLASTHPQLNGMPQDSMDDSCHAYSQDGFWVTDKYPYHEIFAINGYSEKLISGWGFATGVYGSSSISEKRLTESTLRNAGTYGSELVVVYNLLIKHPGEEKYHTVAISDTILIPVNPEWSPSTIEVGFWTGKEVEGKE